MTCIEFGGEGTGIKTMRDFDWKEGDEVTFQVDGQLIGKKFWFLELILFSYNTPSFWLPEAICFFGSHSKRISEEFWCPTGIPAREVKI